MKLYAFFYLYLVMVCSDYTQVVCNGTFEERKQNEMTHATFQDPIHKLEVVQCRVL